MRVIYIFVVIMGISCSTNKRQETSIQKDGLTYNGFMSADSLFEDTVTVYNNAGNVVAKRVFRHGVLEGESRFFDSTGALTARSHYHSGYKQGWNEYFNDEGSIVYRGFYYFNLPVGPVVIYDNSGNPTNFHFVSLENKTLLHIIYNEFSGVSSIAGDLIRYTANFQVADSKDQIGVLLYIMKPPGLQVIYTIYQENAKGMTPKISVSPSEEPFVRFSLPLLDSSDQYVIGAHIYDSIHNKKSFIRSVLAQTH